MTGTDTAARPASASPPPPPGPAWWRKRLLWPLPNLWRSLTSMRTALALLFLLALAAIPGALLPQRDLNGSKTAEYIAERGMTTFTADQHLRYLAEAAEGDEIGVHVAVVDHAPKALHITALIVNQTSRRLACVMETLSVHVDFSTRRPVPFPDDIATLVADAAERDRIGAELPLSGAIAIRR